MMILEQLPPKGVKREQAILELGKEEANGELLFQLVNTEKGKCKTAAQKALAQLEYAPVAPLWAKLVKGKWICCWSWTLGKIGIFTEECWQ